MQRLINLLLKSTRNTALSWISVNLEVYYRNNMQKLINIFSYFLIKLYK